MESAEKTPSIEQIASLVVEQLPRSGKLADLANADLMTIEEETIDQVTLPSSTNCLASKQSPPLGRQVRNAAESSARNRPRAAPCRVNAAGFASKRTSIDARPAASIFSPQMKTLRCDVDSEQTPAVLKNVAIAAARDRSDEAASRNLAEIEGKLFRFVW